MMDFLAQNYIWILVVLVIILMTIIGYVAEKTDFGKNVNKKSKNKAKDIKMAQMDDVFIEPITETSQKTNNKVEEIKPEVPQQSVKDADPDYQLSMSLNSASQTPEDYVIPAHGEQKEIPADVDPALFAPLSQTEPTTSVQYHSETATPEQPYQQPTEAQPTEAQPNETVSSSPRNTSSDTELNDLDLKLPDLQSLAKSREDEPIQKTDFEEDEDDIWKF